MEKKSTVLTIAVATVLAIGLTIYGENVETGVINKPHMVESNAPSDYMNILGQIKD